MDRKERVVLDPSEVAIEGRVELDIHLGNIQIGEAGPDWGDYEINAFMAKVAMGEVAVDEEIPNRTITIPLVLGATGDFDAAREAVQAWAAKVNHQGGGNLKRELIGGSYGEAGGKLFADCVKASLKLGGGSAQARDGIDPDAVLTIEALPDFYGDRIEETAFEGTGDVAKTFQIKGNLPGRAEIFVTEKSGRDQLALPWHFRREGYSAEAPWAMNVEEWELFGAAAKAALAGSAAPKVVTHSSLGTNWTAVAAKTMPHHGVYEVLVRAYTTSETPPEVRLVYDIGDLVDPSENLAMKIPGSNGFYIISLGQVNLEELPIGTHRWRGLLQARGAAGREDVSFDRIWFRSLLESSGKPTTPQHLTQGLVAPSVYDPFNQTAGSATGKSPQVGSAYVVLSGSDTHDFEINTETHALWRKSFSDTGTLIAGLLPGRAIGAGSAKLSNHGIAHDLTLPVTTVISSGYIVRYVDSKNFFAVIAGWHSADNKWAVTLIKYKAKAATTYGPFPIDVGAASPLAGRLEACLYENQVLVSFAGKQVISFEDPDLAPGQALGEGSAYLYDHSTSAQAAVRQYDNFEVFPITFDAANFANRKAWLSHQGLFREGPEGGSAYGPIAKRLSDLPRVPVSGPEESPVELAVMTSRGDLESVADSGRDKLAVQLCYRPCWSNVPGT
ncbi:MAG TPA: hypothetical protein VFK14_00170 [Solirubrobacterales bacterium]|nr:hypothetical protein [Solirubrobacterales bacterium]